MDYKKIISERIKENVDLDLKTIEELIEVPPRADMGDYAFPCFQLAKVFKKSPNAIAKDLSEKINKDGFEKVENLGPYLNFFMDKSLFSKETIEKILSQGDKYGSSNDGQGRNITIDYSSPNIAKPFHVGHLFTTAIGNSLYKILNFEGYHSIGINHLGDWGTQFGKLISAYKRWSNDEALKKDPIKESLRIYVKFHEEAEKDPSLNDEARGYFKKLEDGCEEEVTLWKKFRDLSLVEFNGAKVVMLDDYNMPPCIIKKADGATIYATRDLAAAIYRKKTYNFYKSIYVVGMDQSLHFKQFFKVLKLMGYDWADDCIHIGFGLVRFTDKKLSTRKGDVIFLEDLLNQSIEKTREIINEKSPDLEDKETVAKKVGVGAMIFAYLRNNRERDIVFDWDEILSFEGETGPYVQYSYARGKSILRKADNIEGQPDYSKLNSKEEFELVKLLAGFKNSIDLSIDKLEPSIVTRYVIEVAKAFNKFYNSCNILNTEDTATKDARLKLVEAACTVIKNALYLIGIDVVEKM